MGTNRRSTAEILAAEKARQEQLAKRIKELEQRDKAEERKARTKRLITIGAEVEAYAECEIRDMDAFKRYLEKYAHSIASTQKAKSEEPNTENVNSEDVTSYF